MKVGQLRHAFEKALAFSQKQGSRLDPDNYVFRTFLAELTGDKSWVSVWRDEAGGEYKARALIDADDVEVPGVAKGTGE